MGAIYFLPWCSGEQRRMTECYPALIIVDFVRNRRFPPICDFRSKSGGWMVRIPIMRRIVWDAIPVKWRTSSGFLGKKEGGYGVPAFFPAIQYKNRSDNGASLFLKAKNPFRVFPTGLSGIFCFRVNAVNRKQKNKEFCFLDFCCFGLDSKFQLKFIISKMTKSVKKNITTFFLVFCERSELNKDSLILFREKRKDKKTAVYFFGFSFLEGGSW